MSYLSILAFAGLVTFPIIAQTPPGPGFPHSGWQFPENRFKAELTKLVRFDFEAGMTNAVVRLTGNVRTTSLGEQPVEGMTSLRMEGESSVVLNPARVALEPEKTYVVEYDYRVLSSVPGVLPLGLAFAGQDGTVANLGGASQFNNGSGRESRRFRTGRIGGAFLILTSGSIVLLDNIEVYREGARILRSKLPLFRAAFPRLFNYSLGSPEGVSYRTGMLLDKVYSTMSRYDVLVGVENDHTYGDGAWPQRLRALNPNLRILPYVNAFMAQYLDRKIEAGSAGLIPLFNSGLYSDWFMRGPENNLLISPDFQSNVQMNHSYLSPVHDGMLFRDYMLSYVTDSVLPSGLWDGIHFDQPEWYPNPTLVDRTRDGELPPIDIDGDGRADPKRLLNRAWQEGYDEFYRILVARLGSSQLIFNNAGYISRNRRVLPTANGWLSEIVRPYALSADGDWDTKETGGWYRLLDNYLVACDYARAPQMVAMEFSGIGLGKLTGKLTANGLPDRTPEVERADLRRMRLGLTTTLLGNGFFEYDLVDNTTIPLWFDEFAVDSTGRPTEDLNGKGYLGQPLGGASEIKAPAKLLAELDFEQTKDVPIIPGPDFKIVSDPDVVIGGKFSMVRERTKIEDDGFLFYTDPNLLQFEIGKTYYATFDYKILEYDPAAYAGLLGFTFTQGENSTSGSRGASLYLPDMEGPGQQGTLRAAVKISRPDTQIFAGLTDIGKTVVDNIRIFEGGGGVWRRDFENGIVLVNPMPDTIMISQADIVGPRRRTGIRTIRGVQAPEWNHGGPIVNGLEIPSGDGIVLLADPIKPGLVVTPNNLKAEWSESGVILSWDHGGGPAEGFRIWHGAGEIEQEAATSQKSMLLTDLEPGTTYHARVAAYDFIGISSEPSDWVEWTTPGTPRSLPQIQVPVNSDPLSPGAVGVLVGSNLGNVEWRFPRNQYPLQLDGLSVRVNGTFAPLLYVSPERIEFLTPWNVVGPEVAIQVQAHEVSSKVIAAGWKPAAIGLASAGASVFQADRKTAVDETHPASAGNTIMLFASGLGMVEPPPPDDQLDSKPDQRRCLTLPRVVVGGQKAIVGSCFLATEQAGAYWLAAEVPSGVNSGWQVIELSEAGGDSRTAEATAYFR
jgi:uncharacterized protein (TIGR03437 family)